uniref:Capsid protein n=1 Tax=Geladintestivirus 3 TaxID=3233135 RepID=A0AAU8MH27_9CAUD
MANSNVYKIQTNIPNENNKGQLVVVNVTGKNLADAVSNAQYMTYNGEDIKEHIVNVSCIVKGVYDYTYNVEINPNYHPIAADKTLDEQDAE